MIFAIPHNAKLFSSMQKTSVTLSCIYLGANQISISLNSLKIFLLLIFLQLIIGAFVSGMDAGKVYNTWPLMGSTYFPNDSSFAEFLNLEVFDNPSIVQFVHRNLAYLIVFIYPDEFV